MHSIIPVILTEIRKNMQIYERIVFKAPLERNFLLSASEAYFERDAGKAPTSIEAAGSPGLQSLAKELSPFAALILATLPLSEI